MNAKSICPRCGASMAGHKTCRICELTLGLDTPLPFAPEADIRAVAKRFGDYELLEEIGHGGMGVVYQARHTKLNRLVALKLLLLGQFSSEQAVKRFQREAQAAAALRHPNIVGLHEVGEVEGQHYFTMELVEGRSLASLLRAGPLPPRLTAEYCRALAQGTSAAHAAGIIHRDLKPANILIDLFDQPRITDFGLAKRIDGSSDITLTGHLLGSPNYLAPELAAGREQECGPGTDIFSLGAILYECLTGRPPFLGSTMQETLLRVRDAEPVAPRVLNTKLPRDLETICLKCLEKEPSKRYATAKELAEELGRYLEGEPIHARPISSVARLSRWCRRKPALASSFVLVLLLVLLLGIGAPIATFRINKARLLAEQNLYSSDMRLASQAVKEGAFNHARELLKRHRPRQGADDLRGFEWRYLRQAVQDNEPFRTFEGLPSPGGWARTLLFRPNRFLYNQSLDQLRMWDTTTWDPVPLAPPLQPESVRWQWDPSRESAYAIDQAKHTVKIHSLPKFESGPTVQLPGLISLVAMSEDHQTLAVGFQENGSHRILVWDLAKETRIVEVGDFQAAITNMVFSPDRTLLAAKSTKGVVGIWDLKSLEPLSAPFNAFSGLGVLEFTQDGKWLMAGREIWDLEARRLITLERQGQGEFSIVGFSPVARCLVVSWGGIELTLLDSQTLRMKGTLRGHRGIVSSIAFSADGKLMASASVDQTARIWDLTTQTEVGIFGGFDELMSEIQFSADGQSVVVISGLGRVCVYQLSAVRRRGLFTKISNPLGISRVALSPDERNLATISFDGELTLWDRESRTRIRSVSFSRRDLENYGNLAFAPNGELLAWVTGDALRRMRIGSGEISTTVIDGNHDVNSIAFSPDGRELAFGCGKQVLIHELLSERQERFVATDDEVIAINFSPDGTRIAFGDRQGTVTLCDRASRRVLSKEVKAHPPHVYDVQMSPDGRLLATCGADASIKLWRVLPHGLQLQGVMRGHMGFVDTLAFSPDSSRLVSGSGDQTLKIWDPQRAVELATLYGHHQMVTRVEFGKDGRTIYSSGFDGEIHFWEAPLLSEFDSPK